MKELRPGSADRSEIRILFDLPPDQVSSSQLDQLYAGSGERI